MHLPTYTSRVVPGLLSALLALIGCQSPQVVAESGLGSAAGGQKILLLGQPYAISHKDARSSASKASDGFTGPGGEISGSICGSDLMMVATHKGDHMRVSGFIDSQWNAEMRIKESEGYLTLTGSMAVYGYELRLFGNRLLGAVGRCRIDMRQDPNDADRFVQTWNVRGEPRTTSLRGVDALWSMRPAEQAVLLPMLTECLIGQFFANNLNTDPEVKVGGRGGALPRGTINWSGSPLFSYCGG